MFYNNRLAGKWSKKKVASVVCIAVILIVWLVLTIRINIIFPRKTIEKCGYGEWINYTPDIENLITADVSISPVSCKMYDRAGILKDCTEEQLGAYSVGKEDADYLVFTLDIKNNGQEDISVNRLTAFFFYSTEFNGDCNALEKMSVDINTVAAGETQRVQFVTNIKHEDAWTFNSRERYAKSDVYIIMSQYPLEKRLVFSIEQ